jgi:hypothetical protein
MRYEVQVHFNNCGQLAWHEEWEKEEAKTFITRVSKDPLVIAEDKETGRMFTFHMSEVVAVIVTAKSPEADQDLFRRAYAASEG